MNRSAREFEFTEKSSPTNESKLSDNGCKTKCPFQKIASSASLRYLFMLLSVRPSQIRYVGAHLLSSAAR